MAIGAALGLGAASFAGGLLSTFGADSAAKAQEKALLEEARLTLIESKLNAIRARRRNRIVIGEQRQQIAKSGIRLEGSQMDLLLQNTQELEVEVLSNERLGRDRADNLRQAARSVRKGRKVGLVAGFLGAGTQAATTGLTAAGY